MASKVYVVTDLGPGDGGKGGVVHALSIKTRAHTVIKRGGAQGSHGVRTSSGERFNFSQWGCGTFEGVPTFLSEQMVIHPEALLEEAAALRYERGIYEPFSLLTVDERALCATSFHGIASRLRELARRENPRGTVGTGVGEAYRFLQRRPDLAIMAGDLRGSDWRDRLAVVREQIRFGLAPVIDGGFLAADQAEAAENIRLLYDDEFFDSVVERFTEVAARLTIVGHDYLGDAILARDGVAVVESSHGVLTDRLAGFHPHTSAIRTLPRFAHDMLTESGCENIVHIGVTRAYAVRHGAGPMPTSDPDMADRLLPGSAKDDNRYQGTIRVGPLDLVLLRYAIGSCGGPVAFKGLAITWFDQIRKDGAWRVCDRYDNADDPAFFSPCGEIRQALVGNGRAYLEHQATLADALLRVNPVISELPIDAGASDDVLYDVCAETMEASLGVPVRMVSFGPTELDKLCK